MRASTTRTRWILGLLLASTLAVPAAAQLAEPLSVLDKLDTAQGPVVVRKTGQALVLTLSGQEGSDRWYRVEAGRGVELPAAFRADSAQVHYWRGHLILAAEGQAWHFSVPGLDAYLSKAAQVPDAAELDDLLRGHEVTEIKVSALYSASGPRASRLNQGLKNVFGYDDQQDPGSGGLGGCGTSCTINCGDGSSCTANCGGRRCAQCSCPASCTCS